ncbi:uncharacterized protein LOC119602968 isoform X3 [Lucilia sericata]|uniref:uncharacterized protein LOC119602968 isoform X3 n=1 Tax=Lucilia sericata TaxID=13632 RepID=UPI0018A84F7A|nr:uncharacterized protein LOC119602968 isoform X3 [Lucilia sericata]
MEDDPDGVTPRLEPGGAGPPQKMLIIGSTTANGESNISFHARNNDFEKFAENHMPNRKRKQSDSTIPDEEEDETEDPLVFVSQNMPTVYEDDHRGPFTVYVDTAKAEPRTPINQYRLAKKLLDLKGAVPRGNATKEMIEQMGYREGQMIFKCPKCCSIKPERAHHCSVCQRCIRKMDHHCPWVNNCVGENNQKYFVLFTFYIASISVHAIFLVLTSFAECVRNEWRQCSPYSPPATIFLLLFLTFEALMFAIFTIIMLATQLTAILNDQTGIEQLKKEEARWAKKSRLKSIQSVFGRFSLAWFSPFTKPSGKTRFNSHFYSV